MYQYGRASDTSASYFRVLLSEYQCFESWPEGQYTSTSYHRVLLSGYQYGRAADTSVSFFRVFLCSSTSAFTVGLKGNILVLVN